MCVLGERIPQGGGELSRLKSSYFGQRIFAMCEWTSMPETLGEFNISNANKGDTQMAYL